jgi:hypothetical protein
VDEFGFGNRGEVRSDFLVAQPSALSGIAKIASPLGAFDGYNFSRSPEAADANAIAADWRIVGNDLRNAMEQFRAQHAKK